MASYQNPKFIFSLILLKKSYQAATPVNKMPSLFRRPDESFLLFSLLLSGHPNFNMHGLVVFDKAMTNSNPK